MIPFVYILENLSFFDGAAKTDLKIFLILEVDNTIKDYVDIDILVHEKNNDRRKEEN